MIPSVLPLFPLPDTVLFPKIPLPLHVFETRYRKLVADVLKGHRTIGMVLLRPGWEAVYEGRPPIFPVGCAGRLEQCDPLMDGRFNIVLRGMTRFRVLQEHGGEPYRLASVRPLHDVAGEKDALEGRRKRALEALGRAPDGPAVLVTQAEIPDDVFVNALSQSIPLTPIERQSLLDCDAILGRYDRLIEILEFKTLEQSTGRKAGDTVN
jgi:Lon protease-like protein